MNISNRELSEVAVSALSTKIMKKNYYSEYSNSDNYLIGNHINDTLGLDMMMSTNKDVPKILSDISSLRDEEINEKTIGSLMEEYDIAPQEENEKGRKPKH